jgi:hypothetical protein
MGYVCQSWKLVSDSSPLPIPPLKGEGAGGMGGDVAMFVWAWRLRLFAGARGDARGGSASVGRRLVVGGLLGR